MIDGGAEVLQITARPAWITPVLGIAAAGHAGYAGKCHSSPKFVQSCDARMESLLIGMPMRAIINIDGENIRHIDRVDITGAAIRAILFRDIGR
jgi:hypothetical protein